MKKEEALRKFVIEHVPDADENVMRVIIAIVSLEDGESNEAEEIRSIKIKEDTDGKITAKSIKLYNLLKVSSHDLIGLLIKGSAIPFIQDTKVKIIYALLTLLHDFSAKLSYSFNDQDAKLLLGILELGEKEFTAQEVASDCQRRFPGGITEEQVSRSFEYFKNLKILKRLEGEKYIIRENMTYERN